MPVVFLIAIAVVLVGIFFAATGRGGELAYEQADHAPLDLGPVSAADVALLRPPTAMWGYNMQVTDEALDQIAKAMRERDVTIAYLQDQLATFEHHDSYSESRGVHARQVPGALDPPGVPGALDTPGVPGALDTPGALDHAGAFDSSSFLETLFPATPGPPTIPDPLEPPTDPAAPAPSDTVDALEPQNVLEPQDAPETPDALESEDATEPQVALQPQDTLHSPEPAEPHQGPETHEPSESPEPVTPAEPPAAATADAAATDAAPTDGAATDAAAADAAPTDAAPTVPVPAPPQTPLVLKASGPKPERHEPTQPSPVLPDPGEEHDATEPSATTAPDDPPGPQSAFDTHGWWAEQQEAAREEQARRRAASEQDDESVATAEEQGW